jgi:hypothetical protein
MSRGSLLYKKKPGRFLELMQVTFPTFTETLQYNGVTNQLNISKTGEMEEQVFAFFKDFYAASGEYH